MRYTTSFTTRTSRSEFADIDAPQPLFWVLGAACKDLPGDVLFSDDPSTVARVKEICATCPVVDECLCWGHATDAGDGLASGIFGGMTARERADQREGPRQGRRSDSITKNRGAGIELVVQHLAQQNRCAECWTVIPHRSGRGHQKKYCSEGCRDASKGRSRRVDRSARFCAHCGTPFTRAHTGRVSDFCSESCRAKAQRAKNNPPRPCAVCREPFVPSPHHKNRALYCSKRCRYRAEYARKSSAKTSS